MMKASNAEDFGKITPENFAKLILMIKRGELSSRGAKDILSIVFKDGGNPEVIAKEKGFIQKNDPESLKPILRKIIDANPGVVAEYKSGKQNAINLLIGQAMKESNGSANPHVLRDVLVSLIS